MRRALLIIDMLNDFVLKGAPLYVPRAKAIIPRIKRELRKARKSRVPIIYICDSHSPNDAEFKVWPKHAVRGTEGAQVVKELAPRKGEHIVRKVGYSGFYNTRLNALLKRLRVTDLIVSGLITNICVLYTSVDALMRGYKVTIRRGCVIALNNSDHNFALKQIEKILKPRV